MLRTATHNFGLGTIVGSTPEREIPSARNMNALEVIGEGIVLLLSPNSKPGGRLTILLESGRDITIKSDGKGGLQIKEEHV